MSLSPEDQERIKVIGKRAAALVVGGAIVKYVLDHNNVANAYVYKTDFGHTFIGLLRKNKILSQITGTTDESGEFTPDDIDLPPQVVDEFEAAFPDEQPD